mgnify:CR=1 FL=1
MESANLAMSTLIIAKHVTFRITTAHHATQPISTTDFIRISASMNVLPELLS